MKIYTKTGDDGSTGLFGGTRVSKASLRVHAYGLSDELNCHLGVVRSHGVPEGVDALLDKIQAKLFELGSELAAKPGHVDKLSLPVLGEDDVAALEAEIDRLESNLDPLKSFILPGGTVAASHLHVARAVCRNVERHVVELAETEPIRPEVLQFLNRLADLLFVLARFVNASDGHADVPWTPRTQ